MLVHNRRSPASLWPGVGARIRRDFGAVTETLTKVGIGTAVIWRRTHDSGHITDFTIASDGAFKTRPSDPDNQLEFIYAPGEPEVISGMAPGEKRQFTYSVRANKISDPAKTRVSGQITVDFSYLGQYRIKAGAGEIVAEAFCKVLPGTIGPTVVDTTLYVFYAAGVGEVARIDHTDIHALLLILARGLYRRLHGAYLTALAALVAGIAISLVKGLDYEEALILAAIFTALWLSRDEFYRLESLADQPFSAQWVVAVVVVLAVAFWVGLVSFRHVEYADQLWWQFAFNAQAPRFLRAWLLASVTALSFALWKTLRGKVRAPAAAAAADESERVRLVVAGAIKSSANAALLGDKHFLWSADNQAFIMYGVSGRSWIALGDPVGPQGHHEELGWAFRELVDRHDGRTVFYEVSDEFLSLYVDLGLTLSKLGEEARVPLEGFSLQGSDRAEPRQAINKAKRNGFMRQIRNSPHTAQTIDSDIIKVY